jgi:L-cystine uptake protein TcyP (sodium:dicarboxylate symporter family)
MGLGLLGLSLLWSSSKQNREKLQEAIDGVSEWLMRMGELILLATVFQLAADRTHLFAIEALAYIIFACLAWHALKPINRFIIWPIKGAFRKLAGSRLSPAWSLVFSP